jgi:hypothetical protein
VIGWFEEGERGNGEKGEGGKEGTKLKERKQGILCNEKKNTAKVNRKVNHSVTWTFKKNISKNGRV